MGRNSFPILVSLLLISIYVQGSEQCIEDWSNNCKVSSDCCCNYCHRDNKEWQYGICKPGGDEGTAAPPETIAECKPLWYNQCQKDRDCCSEYCYKGEGENWALGLCQDKPMGVDTNGTLKCYPFDANNCTGDSNCCSGCCWRGEANWAFGVCKDPVECQTTATTPQFSLTAQECKESEAQTISAYEFNAAVTSNGFPAPAPHHYKSFMGCLCKAGIRKRREAAMALGQFLHESDGLRAKRQYVCQNDGCPGNYTTPGCDAPGQYYYGRGYIQLTWCYNYRPASVAIFGDERLVQDPDMVAQNESLAWDTAAWFWGTNVHSLAEVAEQGQFGATTKAINSVECTSSSSENSIVKDRFNFYVQCLKEFKVNETANPAGCP